MFFASGGLHSEFIFIGSNSGVLCSSCNFLFMFILQCVLRQVLFGSTCYRRFLCFRFFSRLITVEKRTDFSAIVFAFFAVVVRACLSFSWCL